MIFKYFDKLLSANTSTPSFEWIFYENNRIWFIIKKQLP